ncbi:tRNA pseudouridine(55) synthase TruB [Ferruginibacter sp. SUN002]|uniref:tRNA pseudouridine(55) synthase TruB n=1 Tax=Ferruginibacter sp. SUN002 TaxID=2937789 RepID=UPI003D35D46D
MARKQTYRQRFTNQLIEAGETPIKQERKERIPIDPVIQQPYVDGKVILIDKPLHWTSFDVVRKLRSLIQIKKIGHAGTLDPLATGLLIVCTGKFTKKINEYMAQQKEYTGSITLGAVTPTYDLESRPEQEKDHSAITNEQIYGATKEFVGEIDQFPPIFSAIKKDGVALYELARRGEEVELKARRITIHAFEITNIAMPVVEFRVVCSTGTYIRSLANDFGKALGCGGYLSSLRRTKIGEFTTEEAMTMEAFETHIKSAH